MGSGDKMKNKLLHLLVTLLAYTRASIETVNYQLKRNF
jgi:hypothetical protein